MKIKKEKEYFFTSVFSNTCFMDRSVLERKIRESLQEGYTLDEIRQVLIAEGYSQKIVDNIIAEFQDKGQKTEKVQKPIKPSQKQQLQEKELDKKPGSREEPSETNEGSKVFLKGIPRSPGKSAIFTVITFFIYFLYWEYLMLNYGVSDKYPEKRRMVAMGLWVLAFIPFLNLVIWGAIIYRILSISPVGKNPVVFTLIYMLLILTGIGIPIMVYLLQSDINQALE